MIPKVENFYVPWPDDSEWNTVRSRLESSSVDDLKRAYEIILMWKLKYDDLPAYIESTLGLLQVVIKEQKMARKEATRRLSASEEYDLRLACSTALIRFVNHVSSVRQTRGETLYWSAKSQNIPDWIVNLRHEAAHSQDLPTLDALHAALQFSLEWLMVNYWRKNNGQTSKVTGCDNDHSAGSQRAADLFECVLAVWDVCNTKKKESVGGKVLNELLSHMEKLLNLRRKHFSDVEPEAAESIAVTMNSMKDMDGNSAERIWTHVKDMKAFLLILLSGMFSSKCHRERFISALLESSFLKDSSIRVGKWMKIIHVIQSSKMLGTLLGHLFSKAGQGCDKASKWLVILHQSLKVLQKKWSMFKVLRKEDKTSTAKKLVKKLNGLKTAKFDTPLLPLLVKKPPPLSLDMIGPALLNPKTPHLRGLLPYLKLVKPSLPESTLNLVTELIDVHEAADPGSAVPERIFTVDDLPEFVPGDSNDLPHDADDADEDAGWTRSQIDVHTWNKCPLGLLPFQTEVNFKSLDNLTWNMETSGVSQPFTLLWGTET